MIAEKKRREKKATTEEPKNRFYVRKWKASNDEMAEVRDYVRSHKSKKSRSERSGDKNKAKRIRKKLIR